MKTLPPISSRIRRSRLVRGLAISGVIASAIALGVAGPAQASTSTSWGTGNGDPSKCANPITVATATIYGSRGKTAGKPIGQLQMRWSQACYGQWSRVVLYGGLYSSPVEIDQVVQSEGRTAGSSDFTVYTGSAGTTAWSPYLRLANSQSRACVQVWLSSDFDTLNYHTNGAQVCA